MRMTVCTRRSFLPPGDEATEQGAPSHVSLPRWSPEAGGRIYKAGRSRLYKWE